MIRGEKLGPEIAVHPVPMHQVAEVVALPTGAGSDVDFTLPALA